MTHFFKYTVGGTYIATSEPYEFIGISISCSKTFPMALSITAKKPMHPYGLGIALCPPTANNSLLETIQILSLNTHTIFRVESSSRVSRFSEVYHRALKYRALRALASRHLRAAHARTIGSGSNWALAV